MLIAGATPLVLVAPHGGRRDTARLPWGTAPLKVNDLHTAALTAELAREMDASAIINTAADRNDVDLNRVSAAHDRAPWFLERLADVLSATLRRHGRATLLTVHGWNVGDRRPLVAALAAMSPAVDAVQLELGIPLRWPGSWRRRFIDACRATLPLLAAGAGEVSGAPDEPPAPPPTSCRLQFAGAPFSG